MKLINVSLLTAAVATANAAVVTVTQHVHENAIVSVEGLVYVENGQTYTTYKTASASGANTADVASSTVIAIAGPAATPISENAVTGSEASTTSTPSTAAATTVAATEQSSVQSSVNTLTTSSQAPTTTLSPSTTTAIATTSSTAAATSSTAAAASSTASATTSSTASSASGLSTFASTILNEHNVKRALHEDTPALSWSDTLATYAQNYADDYDCSGTLTHSGGSYGENLALGYDAAGAVDAWYNEISDYDWSDPSYSSSTGHFTQVVWKSSTQLGCGIKACGGAWGNYVICSYNPAGNYIGEFAENVEPLA